MKTNLNILQKIYLIVKDLIDRLLALILFIALSPALVIISILIRKDSKGPIYAPQQIRIGKNHKNFEMYKFRTMIEGYEKISPNKDFEIQMFKANEDARITKYGLRLRNTDADELPQIINVLRGEMSFVGPRAFQPMEEKFYKEKHPSLRQLINYRTAVKPGITGLWQIAGRNSTGLEKRLELDKKYIDSVNPLLDIYIVFVTIQKLFTKKWEE